MILLKKMCLHLYICTQCCQAWHIHLQFKNIVNTMYAVGPAIDVVRRNYGVNHLHEPGRSLDYSSDSPFKLKLPSPSGRRFQTNHKTLSPLVMFIRLTFGNNKAQPPRTARPI